MSILQLQKTTSGSIGALGAVVFNEIIEQGGDFSYDAVSGEVTVLANGTYVFDWWVSTQSTSASDVKFNLNFSGGSEYKSNSPVKTGNTTGFAIIEVSDAPITVTLLNANNTSVFLSSAEAKAALRAFNILTEISYESNCFATKQLINVLEQIITIYPGAEIQVYTDDISGTFGTIGEIYTAPGSDIPSILVLLNPNNNFYVNIDTIATVYVMDVVYDDSITYLPLPNPFVEICSNAAILGFYNMADMFTTQIMINSIGGFTIGTIIKNEYGILVLEGAGQGFPEFVVTSKMRYINTTD